MLIQTHSFTCTINCILYLQVYSRVTSFIWTTPMCESLLMKPISYNKTCILAMCTKIICLYTAQSFRKTSQCQLPTFPTLTSEKSILHHSWTYTLAISVFSLSCVPNSHADKCYKYIITEPLGSVVQTGNWYDWPVTSFAEASFRTERHDPQR